MLKQHHCNMPEVTTNKQKSRLFKKSLFQRYYRTPISEIPTPGAIISDSSLRQSSQHGPNETRRRTFLVLFNANPSPRLLNPLHLLLVQNQLSAAETLGLDKFAVAVALGLDEVAVAVALAVALPLKLSLEIPDLMTDVADIAARSGSRTMSVGLDQSKWADGDFVRVLFASDVDNDGSA